MKIELLIERGSLKLEIRFHRKWSLIDIGLSSWYEYFAFCELNERCLLFFDSDGRYELFFVLRNE